MKAQTELSSSVHVPLSSQVEPGAECSRFVLNVGLGLSALIGIWGLSCLIYGLTINGPLTLIRQFWCAVTGT
ncbi:hypothetical protein [Desulfogranum mediterraneum]|uniref:hypothetical protein n=1 Tax=Desulfogranum mediterraneum TaxID=160661 RepID=UPI0004061D78|nr:hypothetical protein [Desulfogranum mediterraneum]